MKESVTRDEAIKEVMAYQWTIYLPPIFQVQEGQQISEIEDVIRRLPEGGDESYANFWIAASYYLIWLENLGLDPGELDKSWIAMTDMNNLFSDEYWDLDWETVMLMMDKAS